MISEWPFFSVLTYFVGSGSPYSKFWAVRTAIFGTSASNASCTSTESVDCFISVLTYAGTSCQRDTYPEVYPAFLVNTLVRSSLCKYLVLLAVDSFFESLNKIQFFSLERVVLFTGIMFVSPVLRWVFSLGKAFSKY